MSHVIWHCNGVGELEGYDDLRTPHYRHGISTYAWAVPHGMARWKVLLVDRLLEALRRLQLRIIARATGGTITGSPEMHERGKP